MGGRHRGDPANEEPEDKSESFSSGGGCAGIGALVDVLLLIILGLAAAYILMSKGIVK